MNWGDVPLEDSFRSWTWARADTRDGCHVIYDAMLSDGARSGFLLDISRDGNRRQSPLPKAVSLPAGRWGMPRSVAAAGTVTVRKTLEDAPFYMRSLIALERGGETVIAVHESLSLERFRKPIVQMMLPFRMPRRA